MILYTADDGQTRINLRVEGDSIWLSQLEITEMFQATKQNVSLHAKNIFEEGELSQAATVKESLTVQTEGNRQVQRALISYNLELILAIGYRIPSPRGTQFRQWATRHLEEYLVKGFIMDDERLKNPVAWDYFDELLARIREIRASEKRFYQKVRDLFALSSDYRFTECRPKNSWLKGYIGESERVINDPVRDGILFQNRHKIRTDLVNTIAT